MCPKTKSVLSPEPMRNQKTMPLPLSSPQILTASLLVLTLLSAGCSSLRFPGVYRIDIPQGNFVTEDMLGQLQPNMTPEQVRYVLGQPTLVDPFTPDMWFYPMVYQPGRGQKVEQRIVVHFDNGLYSHHEGEVIKDFRRRVTSQQDRELQERLREQERARQGGDVPQPPAPGEANEPGVPSI